jgi:hypothetical protein
MSIGTRTTLEAERTPRAVARDNLAVGVAMRFAFIGVCLTALGGIAFIAGGIAPLTALTLAVCGGGVAFVSLRFLTRWEHSQRTPAAESAPPTSSASMHQPVCFIE